MKWWLDLEEWRRWCSWCKVRWRKVTLTSIIFVFLHLMVHLLLDHVHVLILRTHVVETIGWEGLSSHGSAQSRSRSQSKVWCSIACMAHVVVGLTLVVEVVHLCVVGGGVVVVGILIVLIVPEVVVLMRHIRQRWLMGGRLWCYRWWRCCDDRWTRSMWCEVASSLSKACIDIGIGTRMMSYR